MTRRFFLHAPAAVLGTLVAAPCFDRRAAEPRSQAERSVSSGVAISLIQTHYLPPLQAQLYSDLTRLIGPNHG